MSNDIKKIDGGFAFKQFTVKHDQCAMKVGTDGVLLGAWAYGGKHILDIGTGTGLVALMMAQRFPNANITAIDIDDRAIRQAQENINCSPFADRVSVKHYSLQQYADNNLFANKFDCIVSNPPFFEESLRCPNESRNTARHTDTLSYEELVYHSNKLLSDNGIINIIIPVDYISRIESVCAYNSLFITEKLLIRTTERKLAKRVLLRIEKHSSTIICTEQNLMCDGCRSKWYADITRDFYL